MRGGSCDSDSKFNFDTEEVMSLSKPTKKAETLQEYNHRLKIEARELSRKHIDVKPIRYDLKS